MRAELQNQINPPSVRNNEQVFSTQKIEPDTDRQTSEEEKVDFDSVLANSADNIRKQREAIKNGDLQAKSQDEFFNKLAEQTKQKVDKKNELKKDDFLKLFVAQLQYQDPLNPDDGAEMATKLAQFNGLEQMMNMNGTLDKLAKGQNTGRNLQLVNYVGKEVSVKGGRIKAGGGQTGSSEFVVRNPAVKASVEVRDAGGALVFERELGPLQPGAHNFTWNGESSAGNPLPEGIYTYDIHARDIEGKKIPIDLTSKARVTGVDIQSDGGALYSELGKVSFDEILSVGTEGFDLADKKQAEPQSQPMSPEQLKDELSRRAANQAIEGNQQTLLDPKKIEAFRKRLAERQEQAANNQAKPVADSPAKTEAPQAAVAAPEKVSEASKAKEAPSESQPQQAVAS